ncbi:MAG: RDD family protein [Verrucomicrobia bacterium]|nr:RDD family protein [Verrucomicrobiota bacterium]
MKTLHCNLPLWVAGLLALWPISKPCSASAQEFGADQSANRDFAAEEPAEPQAEHVRRNQLVVFGHDVHLRKNESCRQMVVIFGDATIEGTVHQDAVVIFGSSQVTGTVRGDLCTILGSVNLDGKVHGSLVNILGSPTLGPRALVERELIAIGGKLRVDPGAIIEGMRKEFAFGEHFQWLIDWLRSGFLLARPLPPQLAWVWFVAGLFVIFYALLAVVIPRPIQACVNALDEAPVASFFVGLLSMILFLPVLVLLSVTVVGVPLLMISSIVAVLLGKVATYEFTGQQLARRLNLSALQLPLAALLIGVLIFYLLYTVPIIGFLVWGAGIIWGVGAVLMALSAQFKRERRPPSAFIVPTGDHVGSAVAPPMEGAASPPPVAGSEAVHFERAGFWIRVGAAMVDLLLIGFVSAFLGHGISFPFLLVIYHVAMWTWKGTTIGGIVFGLKILRVDGRAIDFAVALVRCLFSIVSFVVLLIGFFWAGWDREKQSWHDKIAGTVIVKVPKGISLL